MRVAVFLEQDINTGGGFQQAYSVVDCLVRRRLDDVDYVFFVFSRKNHEFLERYGLEHIWIRQSVSRIVHRAVRKLLRISLGLLIPFQGYIDKVLLQNKIDLVYFLTPSVYAMGLRKHNFIITIWDQCHRDWVEFPEVRNDCEFECRDFFYREVLPKAVAVFVDAELSREKMCRRFGVDLERIHVAKFFPLQSENSPAFDGSEVDVCAKYSIKKPFIFYPAQLWAHKNHIYILKALKLLESKNAVEAVFVGNDFGNRSVVEESARRLGISQRCHFLGLVPRGELISLYKSAIALVMPTYFGPTNIPPLEAFLYGCPVCYSDLPGLREQVGDAAFLVDLNNPGSLTEAIEIILQNDDRVNFKIKKGYERLRIFSEEEFMTTFSKVLRTYRDVTGCE
jgi:glycosyltransferase involved in cell wall biosynthesis